MKVVLRIIIFFLVGFGVIFNVAWAQSDAKVASQSLKQQYMLLLLDYTNHQKGDPFASGIYKPIRFRNVAPSVSQIVSALKRDNFQNDPDIRSALSILEQSHPITPARFYASKALLEDSSRISLKERSKINKNRKYCTTDSLNVKSLPSLPESLKEKLTPVWKESHIFMGPDGEVKKESEKIKYVNISAQPVTDGWLTGYSGRTGLGLHYIPEDETFPTQYLMQGTIHAIIPHKDKTSFFVLSTDANKIGGIGGFEWPLKISLVKQIQLEEFEITPYRILPQGLRGMGEMENGDVFFYFGDSNKSDFMSSGRMPIEVPAYYNNPPIAFTNTGQIYEACVTNARKF